MTSYLVCVEGDEDVIDEASTVQANSSREAAIEYVLTRFGSLDCPKEIVVFVKPEFSAFMPCKLTVYAETEVRFRAIYGHELERRSD